MVITIEINDGKIPDILKAAQDYYGRDVNDLGIPVQTDADYLNWVLRKILKERIDNYNIKQYTKAAQGQDIGF